MKIWAFHTIALILIVALTSSYFLSAHTVKGVVIDGYRKIVVAGASVVISDTSVSLRKGKYADKFGQFIFPTIDSGTYSIRIISVSYSDTTFHNIHIDKDTTLIFDIYRFCRYDTSKTNSKCPICHKKNKVIPIIYGLPISVNGDNSSKYDGIKYLTAGCKVTNCDPNWYCKRDKVKF